MSKGTRAAKIQMIPIDQINILNPRVRSKKIFTEITDNIAQVGLKRPITVTRSQSRTEGKDYDLVCGQGRLEAFIDCHQSEIPAIIIDVNEEQALIMSLVENLARRQHRALDLLQGLEIMKKQGHDQKAIAEKTGLSTEYVSAILNLLERGEERLIAAVESGKIPLSMAVSIAQSTGNDQHILQEAYEKNLLRGKKLLLARHLLEVRRSQGKSLRGGRGNRKGGKNPNPTAQDLLKVYQKDVDRKRSLTRKAEQVNNRLLFVTEALRQLLCEDHFNTLLRAEGLSTMPKQLMTLLDEKGRAHG